MLLPSRRPNGLRLIFPTAVKIKCMEVTPDITHDGGNWAPLWANWKWSTWIKPQIDLAVANGANCIKVATYAGGLYDTEGGAWWPEADVQKQHIVQFLNYCQSLNLGVYLNFCGGGMTFGTSNRATRIAALADLCGFIENLPGGNTVIGIDLANEVQSSPPSTWSNLNTMAADIGILRTAIRAVSTIPVTASVYLDSKADWTNNYMQALAPVVDFHDGHPYYGMAGSGTVLKTVPAASDLTPLVNASWFKNGIFCGEAGTNGYTGTATQTTYLNGIGALTAHPKCFGTAYFCIADYDVQQFGVVDNLVSNPRPIKLAGFRTWPGALN